MTDRMRKRVRRLLWLIIIGIIAFLGYSWAESQPALSPVKTVPKQLFGQTKIYSQNDRQQIASKISAQDQSAKGLTKQGFVAIPKLSILLPIYDNAYSAVALNVGANTAQKVRLYQQWDRETIRWLLIIGIMVIQPFRLCNRSLIRMHLIIKMGRQEAQAG